jgi:hypothetical protein
MAPSDDALFLRVRGSIQNRAVSVADLGKSALRVLEGAAAGFVIMRSSAGPDCAVSSIIRSTIKDN